MFSSKGEKKLADSSGKVKAAEQEPAPWKGEMSEGSSTTVDCPPYFKTSYDPGSDSGFLSGNINSEIISGEIVAPPSPEPRSEVPEIEAEEDKSFMRLDSGVDVDISDQLSELSLDKTLINDLNKETKTESVPIVPYRIEPNIPAHKVQSSAPWELYFQQDEEGDTQLHIAIIQGFIEVVYSLVRMVPSPIYLDILNDMRQTGLHLAVLTSQPKIVRCLVSVGARTNIVDRNGNTPLHLAIAAGDVSCVRALTDPVTSSELYAACPRYLPRQRSSTPPEFDVYNYEGLTCVHLAVLGGHIEILRQLNRLGADVDAREWKCGRTPLHLAVENGDETMAVILLKEMRAEAGLRNYAGQTAYYTARRNSRFLRTLVDIGVPQESDYSSSDEDDDDISDNEFQKLEPFRDIHTNGGIVNATA